MDFRNWIRSYVIEFIPIVSFMIYVLGFAYPQPDPFVVHMVNGQIFSNQEFTYIGESSTSLFLYHRQNDQSLVLNRQNILSVSNNSLPK